MTIHWDVLVIIIVMLCALGVAAGWLCSLVLSPSVANIAGMLIGIVIGYTGVLATKPLWLE